MNVPESNVQESNVQESNVQESNGQESNGQESNQKKSFLNENDRKDIDQITKIEIGKKLKSEKISKEIDI